MPPIGGTAPFVVRRAPLRPVSPLAAVAANGASAAADRPVRWGIDTEIGATGGSDDIATPDCDEPSTEVEVESA